MSARHTLLVTAGVRPPIIAHYALADVGEGLGAMETGDLFGKIVIDVDAGRASRLVL
jgi:hypothetical protein